MNENVNALSSQQAKPLQGRSSLQHARAYQLPLCPIIAIAFLLGLRSELVHALKKAEEDVSEWRLFPQTPSTFSSWLSGAAAHAPAAGGDAQAWAPAPPKDVGLWLGGTHIAAWASLFPRAGIRQTRLKELPAAFWSQPRCSAHGPGVWAGGCLRIFEHVSMGVCWLHTKNPWLIFLQTPE